MGVENSADDGEVHCPYCHTTQNCDHFLLMVDTADREAKGGALRGTFNARLNRLFQEGEDDPKFGERHVFQDLLAYIESLADGQIESECAVNQKLA